MLPPRLKSVHHEIFWDRIKPFIHQLLKFFNFKEDDAYILMADEKDIEDEEAESKKKSGKQKRKEQRKSGYDSDKSWVDDG